MPYLTTAIAHNVPEFEAWRWAFFVPGAAHVIIAFLVMVAATVRSCASSVLFRGCSPLVAPD